MSFLFYNRAVGLRVPFTAVLKSVCLQISAKNKTLTRFSCRNLTATSRSQSSTSTFKSFQASKLQGDKQILVYHNNNKLFLRLCHASVTISTVISAGWACYVFLDPEMQKPLVDELVIEDPLLYAAVANVMLWGLYAFMHFIRKRSLLKISYNLTKKQFEADQFDFFLRRRPLIFKPGEARLAREYGTPDKTVLGDLWGNFIINSRRYFLHHGDFKNPLYFNIMLGIAPTPILEKQSQL